MDYDDNDCGGQNLHLAGEESSKISSVLRPFSLPKFDFDDSIHGHLRFDSLVENEVFLGIPSQEENHWIEDFSRGSSGIEFSSNPTESCALPRHDNVWSEATSSESVEMLLKAVGQEEVPAGETMVEGSDPQHGSSTKQVEVNLENDQMDYVLEGEGCGLRVTSENLHTDLKSSMENKCDSSGLLNKSLSKQEQENLPVPGTGVDNNESSSQMITGSIVETGDEDEFCNPNFVNTVSVAKDMSTGVEVHKEGSMSNEFEGGNDAEDISLDMSCHLENPVKLESTDHAADVRVTTIGGTSGISGKGESVPTFEDFSEASFVAAGDSDCGTTVCSSGTKIKQLSEGRDMLTDKPSSPLQGKECVVGIGIKGQRDDLGNSADSSFNSVGYVNKTVIEDITILREVAAIHEENLEHEDNVPPALLPGSIQTCRENDLSVHSDVHECKLETSKLEDDKMLPLDSMNLVCDDNEEGGKSNFSGEVVEVNLKAASFQSNNSNGENPVLNSDVSDTTLISSGAIGSDLADCVERGSFSYDIQNNDLNKPIKLEANKEAIISRTKVPFGVADEYAPAIGLEKGTMPDAALIIEATTVDHSSVLMQDSSAASCDKASKDLNENKEHSAPGLTVQDDAEDALSEKPKEAEGSSVLENSSAVSATIHGLDNDELDQLSVPGIRCTELSRGKLSKCVNLKNSDSKIVGNVSSPSVESKTLSKEEGIYTSDIRHFRSQIRPTGDSNTNLQSVPSTQANKLASTGTVTPPTSGGPNPAILKGIPHETSLISDGVPPSGSFKGSTERKSKRGSSKSVKESAKKGNQVKEKSSLRQTEKGDKSCGPVSPLVAGHLMTHESVVKPRAPVSIPGSSLPDLNTSAPLSAFFQQPFTDLQQVQLRAQIFVYGSLIQGAAPDEVCMVSAFGASDGSRSIWEPSWRSVVEKANGPKSQRFNSETPVRSSSGAKAPDQVSRHTFTGNEVLSSPAGRASNKVISSQAINPLIPLSSPLWSISVSSCEAMPASNTVRCAGFDYPAVSPVHPYHTPPIRNLVSHTTSWQAQASFPVPWGTSQSSPFDISNNYAVFPISEPVKSTTAVKGSSSVSSGVNHVSPVPAIHTGSTALFPGASSLDLIKTTLPTTQTPNTKSRKRKKSSGVVDVLQASVTAKPADSFSTPVIDNRLSKKASAKEDFGRVSISDSMPIPVAISHYSTSIALATPSSSVPKGKSIQFNTAAWPSISSDHHKSGDPIMDNRALVFEESSKVEVAKLHAEEAATHAAAAVRHCQGLWSQLEQQKNSGLKTEAEAKLASAAVAVAAAASVAKAAAAAAKVALNAAMQAKQIADESLTKCGTLSAPECDSLNLVDNLANAIPVSILKGGDYNNTSSSVISAAKEAARKRVEDASAATRQAENLDAIVKAAELAAEAVSHAGKVVAMGDPFTLSQLVEAGPDGYWKVLRVASVPGPKSNDVDNSKSDNSNVADMHAKDMHVTSHITLPAQRVLSRDIVDACVTVEEGLMSSIKHGEKNSKAHNDKRVTKSDKTSGIAAEPFVKSRLKSYTPATYDNTTIIKEGSIVEVLKDRGDLKKVWVSADVLSLKDHDAFVCFTGSQSDQGTEQLKEWVSLEAKDGNPPIVRIPHPMTAMQFEGTRKRRRAAVKDYTWSVGDKVDAWVQDCWHEGIISEKNKKDTTTWSVHFPGQGETLDVKVWHLRPTVIWIDGQWIEWCRSGQDRTSQGDTPTEKRPKLGSTVTETKEKSELSKSIVFAEVDKAEHRLPLSAEDTVFNVGSSRDGKIPDVGRTKRSGSQKVGSRVVIGVPRPGKKRKFIEVNKHYVSDRSTMTVPDDSVKLAKFLTYQGPGSRGLKNNSKIDLKEKQVAEVKCKAPKSGKPQTIPHRILPRKDGLTSSHSNASDAALSNDYSEPVEKSLTEFQSFSNVPDSAIVSSSRAQSENRKKTTAVNTMSERLKKGKLAPSRGKLEKNEADENVVSGTAEPRRSIRRIQPTSRLLEGLQSSITIPKLPTSSHDKSQRSHTKNTNKGYSSRS